MTVYLEYAVLDNFTMDFFLLFCAAVTLKIPFKKRRLFFGAAVGTVTALVSVWLNGILLFVTRAVCLFAMCAAAIGFGKKLFWYILLTLAYTFLTGGAIVGIFNLTGVGYIAENGFFYNMPVPLFVYFVGAGIVAFLCYSLSSFVKKSREIAPYLTKVKVKICGKTYIVWGFRDSGNTVTCHDAPVCFVTKKFGNIAHVFAEAALKKNAEKVEISTLAGNKIVLALPATLEADGVEREVFLALPAQKCKTNYELLLNAEITGNRNGDKQ